jgi:(p)ppGpp synthase/HD superfamily hydrolase
MVITALLHDAAEDHGGAIRLLDIEQNLGAVVAHMVEGLSDTLAESGQEKERWEDRKSAYLRKLEVESAEVQLSSVADKVHNARTMLEDYRVCGAGLWKRFKRGRDQQLWYMRELLSIYRGGGKGRLTDEFERLIAELCHATG